MCLFKKHELQKHLELRLLIQSRKSMPLERHIFHQVYTL